MGQVAHYFFNLDALRILFNQSGHFSKPALEKSDPILANSIVAIIFRLRLVSADAADFMARRKIPV